MFLDYLTLIFSVFSQQGTLKSKRNDKSTQHPNISQKTLWNILQSFTVLTQAEVSMQSQLISRAPVYSFSANNLTQTHTHTAKESSPFFSYAPLTYNSDASPAGDVIWAVSSWQRENIAIWRGLLCWQIIKWNKKKKEFRRRDKQPLWDKQLPGRLSWGVCGLGVSSGWPWEASGGFSQETAV